MLRLIIISVFLFVTTSFLKADDGDKSLKLWYQHPADKWMKSTPIGNGRLGAMVYGGINHEIIALNEITMWSGQYDENQDPSCGKEKLAAIRKLFFEGKIEEGNAAAEQLIPHFPKSYGTQLPVGDLKLSFDYDTTKVTGYSRELDLRNAITSVSFKIGNVNFKREYFCSNPDNVLIIKLTADTKKSINFDLGLDLLRKSVVSTSKDQIEFNGQVSLPEFVNAGVAFIGKINVSLNGGIVYAEREQLKIEKADEVVIAIDIRTNFNSPNYKALCDKTIANILAKPYEKIKEDHIRDYARLFNRVTLSLGKSNAEVLPTDIRLADFRAGKDDPGLLSLFFQYGRYLLIASSRENSPLPGNLQGLWNDNLACNMGWTCDYHLDINTQQNYWLSNITNLPECNIPLFNYIELLRKYGEKTAMKVYGSPGWVAHTVTNIWGYTSPGWAAGWGVFPTASAWISSHLWTHYCYTKDVDFLRNKAYPILKENAVFFLDYMVVNPNNGYLSTGPSTSPENTFVYNGKGFSLSMMPTCDRVLVYELFTSCIAASEILNIDDDFRNKLKNAVKMLPPIKIGKSGEIQEWLFDDVPSIDPNHRHTTHLLCLYPFNQISLNTTPELAKAAKKNIDNKLNSPGFEDVEWSRANAINFYARLKEPEQAYNSVFLLLKKLVRDNLFTISVGGIAGAQEDIFVLDGNAAATAGIAEMLIQSQNGYIELLPAIPKQWNTGNFKGLCVRGGAEVDVQWKDGLIKQASIKATTDNMFKIKLPDSNVKFLKNGKELKLPIDAFNIVSANLKSEETLNIQF